MLEIKEISKTFNAGTINEKKALSKLSLTLNEGDFVTVIGGKRCREIHTAQRSGRGIWCRRRQHFN